MPLFSDGGRLIDDLPPPAQKRTIKVLCLGAPRSGTASMTVALKKLGYKCYEGIAHSIRYENRFPHWCEAFDAKYRGIGKPFTADDFDKILGGYEMTCSWPSVLFVEELLAAYPDAKVILTNRDVDSWLAAIKNTIHWTASWKPSYDWMTPFVPGRIRDFRRCVDRCSTIWYFGPNWSEEKAREQYLEHYDHVRSLVPKDRLLEHSPADGWKPLCAFLDKPIPDELYPQNPQINETANFRKSMQKMWWATFFLAAVNITLTSGAILFAATTIQKRRWLRH